VIESSIAPKKAEPVKALGLKNPRGGVQNLRMRFGDLLVRDKLVTQEQIAEALKRQSLMGGRLGEHLVAIGAITDARLEAFLHRMPMEPPDVASTGLDESELLALLMKLIYSRRLKNLREYVEAIKLPHHVVVELVARAVERKFLYALGARNFDLAKEMGYEFTDEGRRWTIDAMDQMRYVGPAPVTLEEYTYQINLQKLTNETVSYDRLAAALSDLSFDESFVEHTGPALNSGRAILLYGPPGNGKTSIAFRLASVFADTIYVPYAISVEGQIIRVHDPSVHTPMTPVARAEEPAMSIMRREDYDMRWVPCKRPFVVAGGELTLEMLDLSYDESSHFYDAPLHMKALGGCFVIDDLGRQLVSPTKLLNRWIVPLESRIDYLKLHTGKSFSIPFDELVIVSTNLEPEDLMDTAFLRRLPYKIEIKAPSLQLFKKIFMNECARRGLMMTEETMNTIITRLTEVEHLELAAYQPKFIVDQLLSTCRFLGVQPHFELRYLDYAIENLRVRRSSPAPAATLKPQVQPTGH
jgi:DNA polymerase III delta prime subunit